MANGASTGAPAELASRFAGWSWAGVPSHTRPDRPRVWRMGAPDGGAYFLKLSGLRYPTVMQEVERTGWAGRYVSVPEVIEHGELDGAGWMLTRALPGVDATNPAYLGRPEVVVPLLARGLRAFHEALPVAECPFDFRNDAALQHVSARLEAGMIDLDDDLHPEHEVLRDRDLMLELTQRRPATEDLVVCHGDYCFPNALIERDVVMGYIDLGELGVADRWWDLAVGAWSTTWNVGPGWEDIFLDAYGVARDDERIAYYRLLYDLAS